MSHITVERNRRRQMNEHLKVLRSLTPCFYIKRVSTAAYTTEKSVSIVGRSGGNSYAGKILTAKDPGQFSPLSHRRIFRRLFAVILKMSGAIIGGIVRKYYAGLQILYLNYNLYSGDQASIIGGAIEFIKEMQQLLHSLETKKKRKSLSPSPSPSSRPSVLQLSSPPPLASCSPFEAVKELSACCNSSMADVEAKISGSNVILKTLSKSIPGQVVRIISLLEREAFEILHLSISSMEDTVLYSFVIKIGLQCKLSVEELAFEVQQSFSQELLALTF